MNFLEQQLLEEKYYKLIAGLQQLPLYRQDPPVMVNKMTGLAACRQDLFVRAADVDTLLAENKIEK